MKLYTKTGDDGTTGLFGGARVSKDSLRVCTYGDIDEVNAALGWCAVVAGPPLHERLRWIQDQLFVVGAELAADPENQSTASFVPIDEAQVRKLEGWIDEAVESVSPLRHFVLPGGGETSARLHLARVVCRRAERSAVRLARDEGVRPVVIHYLNRLSDLLFAWARWMNHVQGCPEVLWIPARTPS